jgi:hypothetical protein
MVHENEQERKKPEYIQVNKLRRWCGRHAPQFRFFYAGWRNCMASLVLNSGVLRRLQSKKYVKPAAAGASFVFWQTLCITPSSIKYIF